jgi:hypothetical protein
MGAAGPAACGIKAKPVKSYFFRKWVGHEKVT